MNDYSAEEIRAARAPIASLLSKSEKAVLKLTPGTWQHTMLTDNIRALQTALPLISESGGNDGTPTPEDLGSSLRGLDSMIERVADTKTKFTPGTSQHTLQRNRLKALRIARHAVIARLGED